MLTESMEYDYETEEEAMEEAREAIKDKIEDWKYENAYQGETEEDFEIKIIEGEVEEE